MSKADTDHRGSNRDGLMAGLHIGSGTPASTPTGSPTEVENSGGTLTGLATRNSEGVLTRCAQAF